ncbi:MAG TPA: hypothetical protein VLO13_03160, partial [Halomonas sp.]|nr:hypothetical protein [Halomonas sp.]
MNKYMHKLSRNPKVRTAVFSVVGLMVLYGVLSAILIYGLKSTSPVTYALARVAPWPAIQIEEGTISYAEYVQGYRQSADLESTETTVAAKDQLVAQLVEKALIESWAHDGELLDKDSRTLQEFEALKSELISDIIGAQLVDADSV